MKNIKRPGANKDAEAKGRTRSPNTKKRFHTARPQRPQRVARGNRSLRNGIDEAALAGLNHGVILTMENHYKDSFWRYPEFAQKMDVFLEIVEQLDSPWFGVNFDPSNTVLAGEDPIQLLKRVKHRVVSMHASDRYLTSGTLEDLRNEENEIGYANRLAHGVIGEGVNDYDAIFTVLSEAGFHSWISIEDGMHGMDDLRDSVRFLKAKIEQHFSA
jgi:sugar phosphate isomerase/epimerase